MEEKTTIDKINEIIKKEEENSSKLSSIHDETESLRKKKANIILRYFKEKNLLGLMTWFYAGRTWETKIELRAKENCSRCPNEIIDLLNPDYHDHFYFSANEDDINEIETGVKMGLHFSDGDIYMTIEIDDENNKNKMVDFIKKYGIKIVTKEIEEEIKHFEEEIRGRKKILKFSKEVNG